MREGGVDSKPAKLDHAVASFLSRRAASPDGRSDPIIVRPDRRRHPSPGLFARAQGALALKGTGLATDLMRAGRTVAGRGTSGRPPGICAILRVASLSELGDYLLCGSRMDLSPHPETASLVTRCGPRNQRAASYRGAPHTEARTAPTGEVGTARALALDAPLALGRGLRHPTTCALAIHHPLLSARRTYL